MHDRLQSLILEKIARGDSVAETFEVLCRHAERLSPGAICSILAIDRDGRIRPLAAPSLAPEFSEAIDGLPIGPSVGSCGTAAYLGEAVVVTDIATDPLWADYRDAALPLGLRACWSTPIFNPGGTVVGTFAFYFAEPRGPTEPERRTVEVCTHLCAIALDREVRRTEVERLAYFDTLTGLANRASFDAELASRDYASERHLAMLIIDIDELKIVNDTFGPRVGDRLLNTIAHRIQDVARPATAYRIGGDEFAIIVSGEDAVADAEQLAGRLLSAIRRQTACEGHRLTPSASIGLAIRAESDIGGELVRQNASLALQEAKEHVRGGISRYSEEQRVRIATQLRAIGDVHKALADKRVRAAYQPIVTLATGEIVGVEALCRIQGVDGRIIPAGEFHNVFTDGQIASRITRAMVGQIARDLEVWRRQGIEPGYVGINLSTADFVDGSAAMQLEELLCVGPRPLEGIVIEITESVYLGRLDTALACHIERLRGRGARIALDDFGTGFASLTHLLSMPIDMLKIDKSFVDGLAHEREGAAIIEGLVRMSDRLGLNVVAEGIETEQQRQALAWLGCTTGQGYLFAPALSFEAISEKLAAQAATRAALASAA